MTILWPLLDGALVTFVRLLNVLKNLWQGSSGSHHAKKSGPSEALLLCQAIIERALQLLST